MITLKTITDYKDSPLVLKDVLSEDDFKKGEYIYAPGAPFHGMKIAGIDEDGDLLLENGNPEVLKIIGEEVHVCIHSAYELAESQTLKTCEFEPPYEPVTTKEGLECSPIEQFYRDHGKTYNDTVVAVYDLNRELTLLTDDCTVQPILKYVQEKEEIVYIDLKDLVFPKDIVTEYIVTGKE